MSNLKITDLSTYTNPDPANDVLEIVNVSGNQNQKITRNNFLTITSTPVGINDIQTLINKTLTAPILASPVFSGTITGTYTLGGTPTFPSSVVTLTGNQTLTNKILTSPTINAPTITNASITQDAVTGFSSANTGTVYGISVTNSTLGTTALAANAVQANQLATNAITLGYTQITSNFTTTSGTAVQVTGLTVTVTIPAGGRRTKITVYTPNIGGSGAANTQFVSIWDGTVGSGTQLQEALSVNVPASNSFGEPVTVIAAPTPSSGSKTYNVGFRTSAGTGAVNSGASSPSFILVEVI